MGARRYPDKTGAGHGETLFLLAVDNEHKEIVNTILK